MMQPIEKLARQFISGEMDEGELAKLEQLLMASQENRDTFNQLWSLHTDLFVNMRADRLTSNIIEVLTNTSLDSEGTGSTKPESNRRIISLRSSVFLTLACGLLAACWVILQNTPSAENSSSVAKTGTLSEDPVSPQLNNSQTTDAVATLYDSADAVWRSTRESLEPGSRLPAGKLLHLKSGLAELAFRSGVQVLIEGPAKIKLISDMELLLVKGRLTAEVPEDAIGFSVRTESARIIDLGTVFGVNVDDLYDAEVVVFDGEVIVSPRGEPKQRQRLLAGGMIRTGGIRGMETISQPSFAPFIRSIDRIDSSGEGTVVANFRRDFLHAKPDQEIGQPGWRYLWNSKGPLGRPQNYVPLTWNGSFAYSPNGTGPFPAPDPAYSLHLREFGGHPGRDATTSEIHDFGHGPVVAFTVSAAGQYAITDSWLARLDVRQHDEMITDNEFGLDVIVHVNDHAPLLQQSTFGGESFSFDRELGQLQAGDTIYIGIGPNSSSRYDTFHWNFSIVRWDIPKGTRDSKATDESVARNLVYEAN